ncbi:MAG: acyl carrier protein [Gammaproteobacteria bacterium]|uniref:acyl carrier protein n=1 Tax=Rhodoferax sp. TaxID=50421 RepID=UPI0017F9F300|nr:acyl carrier protein [Rhodoferax sp.]MBU3897505.1 acyl carrier protein [Gammaproteobacteria bacterium]MBA3058013.1 acyl carrier protein [Rhodoferax sp.]MBU3998824.1 acyl carrier protein [Gammaproteobacteria bacterium]MBU4018851.1 acyl carrier protein [Gammaproteobacteria bacterium]MBU4079806.1 acyl carrier protein [Gammaproteobacteria bacterium]
MSKNIEQTVRDVMSIILNLDAAEISDNTSMDNTPGWDSANHINLVLALEEEFSISFEVSEFELMVSYFDVVQVVSAKL